MGRFVSDTDAAAAGIHAAAAAADFGDPNASGSTVSATQCTQWLKPMSDSFYFGRLGGVWRKPRVACG